MRRGALWPTGRVWLAVVAMLFLGVEAAAAGHRATHDFATHSPSCAVCAASGAAQLPAPTPPSLHVVRIERRAEWAAVPVVRIAAPTLRPRSRSPPAA